MFGKAGAVAVTLLAGIALVGSACSDNAGSQSKGEAQMTGMDRQMSERTLPLLDLEAPGVFETATLAFG